jgi:hypothetical protein
MGAPAVVAIAFAAASTAVAGASYLSQRSAAKNQFTLDESAIELERERARLQAAEGAAIHASGFRKALASQVALSSLRGGAGSVTRQFTSESYGNFMKDQEAIKRGVRLSDIKALNELAGARGAKSAANIRGLTQFAGTALNSFSQAAASPGVGAWLDKTFPGGK